jgi:hypothetical protein
MAGGAANYHDGGRPRAAMAFDFKGFRKFVGLAGGL